MTDYLPLSLQEMTKEKLNAMHPAVLSFVGDAVQTLFVRVELASEHNSKTAALHKMAAAKINASSQAEAVRKIVPLLTEEEESVFKRCRNCKTNTQAKNASITDYRAASGFEGLIGFLYLSAQHERLLKLLSLAYDKDSEIN